jgi:hypothetical protein
VKTKIIRRDKGVYAFDYGWRDESLKIKDYHYTTTEDSIDHDVGNADDRITQCLQDFGWNNDGTVILDAGCEMGSFGSYLRKSGCKTKIVGVDIHYGTCEIAARRKVNDEPIYDLIVAADVTNWEAYEEFLDAKRRVLVAYDIIEHLPIDLVQSFLDLIKYFDVAWLSTPATNFGMVGDETNPYNTHVRCYDPVEQLRFWGALDFWSCTSGGRLVGLHSGHHRKKRRAVLNATPIKFAGTFSRGRIYRRLRHYEIRCGVNYVKSVDKLRRLLVKRGVL